MDKLKETIKTRENRIFELRETIDQLNANTILLEQEKKEAENDRQEAVVTMEQLKSQILDMQE
jgi:chromosome segregation ATPase